jgi:hypothetical protein
LTKGLLKITTLVIDKMAVTPAAGWLDTNGWTFAKGIKNLATRLFSLALNRVFTSKMDPFWL